MTREILFRGKRLDNGEWVEGYYMRYGWTGEVKDRIMMDGASALYAHEVDPATVGQYTGLKDKHGKKIFEGDFCRDSLGWTFEVVWDSDNGRFLGRHSKPRGDTYICYVGREPAVEVISNVHDTEATPCTE